MIFLRVIVDLWISLYNSVQIEFWHGFDEGNMEYFGRQAIAYYGTIEERHTVYSEHVVSSVVSQGLYSNHTMLRYECRISGTIGGLGAM